LIEGGKMVSTYLNKPPMTKAKKINAPANSGSLSYLGLFPIAMQR